MRDGIGKCKRKGESTVKDEAVGGVTGAVGPQAVREGWVKDRRCNEIVSVCRAAVVSEASCVEIEKSETCYRVTNPNS